MAVSALDKGKGRALPEELDTEGAERTTARATSPSVASNSSESDADSDSSDSSSSSSESEEDSDFDSDSEEDVTPEFLESLLAKARQNATRTATKQVASGNGEEEFIQLNSDDEDENGKKKEPYVLPVLMFIAVGLDPTSPFAMLQTITPT
ncbi:hypothetical protein ONZ51_g13381 [Trametes cubensis]|uniref:Uncharacterized protein n=1 Tax=Trametes cubensis TaxID=1111947 RepID=A0AAD7TEI9_9APHY|nr:hypothetical protein ONZ51_g13381 [Trametes cubensis]